MYKTHPILWNHWQSSTKKCLCLPLHPPSTPSTSTPHPIIQLSNNQHTKSNSQHTNQHIKSTKHHDIKEYTYTKRSVLSTSHIIPNTPFSERRIYLSIYLSLSKGKERRVNDDDTPKCLKNNYHYGQNKQQCSRQSTGEAYSLILFIV